MVKEHKGGKAPGVASDRKRPPPHGAANAGAAAKKTKFEKGPKPTKVYEQPDVRMSK